MTTPISVQVFAVKESLENGKPIYQDLGIKGTSCRNLQSGSTQIVGLKFITTSYYHKVKLVIILGIVI